jgi:integrase
MAKVVKRCSHKNRKDCGCAWVVRYWQDGKQRERIFKLDWPAARKFSKEIEAAKVEESKSFGSAPKPVTFGDYAKVWLEGYGGSAGSKRIYGSALRTHLVPKFGDRELQAVASDREGVTAFLRGLSAGTQPVVYTALRAMLSEAERAGRIDGTRLGGIRLEAPSKRAKFTFPTHKQLETMAAEMGDLAASVWIMRACGCRPGEALAVQREDFSNGRLRVHQQVQAPRVLVPLKARKAGQYRDTPCPAYLRAIIEELPNGFLFPEVTVDQFRDAFERAAKAAGLEGFNPHQLRHCFASVALASGIPITDVSRWLGHRNIQTTFETYGHLLPDSWESARAALDAEFESWSAAS